jgi:purine-binding chemotaxis protein CheW
MAPEGAVAHGLGWRHREGTRVDRMYEPDQGYTRADRTGVTTAARPDAAPRGPMLKFTVGGLSCALPLADVQEITAMVWITPLPGAAPNLLGVIDCHGTPCPVVDVRHLLNLPAVPIEPEHHLVVLRLGAELLAIPCDRAETVLWASVRPVAGAGASGQVIQGLIQGGDSVTLVLDSAHLLKGSPIGETKLERLARGRPVEGMRNGSR